MRRAWVGRSVIVTFGAVAGCSALLDIHDPIVADRLTDSGSADQRDTTDALFDVDGDVDVDGGRCPTQGGKMIDFGTFCIDGVEVSGAAYTTFLSDLAKPPLRSVCNWKTSYVPTVPVVNLELPIVYVDWCDAVAFCQWAGKRLCGSIGTRPDGTHSLPVEDVPSPTKSEPIAACSDFGMRSHSYGKSFQTGVCNLGEDSGLGVLERSDQRASCVGSKPELFALMGNAWEWVDACTKTDAAVEDVPCRFVGGSYRSPVGSCFATSGAPRDYRAADVGFRCCY